MNQSNELRQVTVPTDHVKAIFRKPAAIFGMTAPPPPEEAPAKIDIAVKAATAAD